MNNKKITSFALIAITAASVSTAALSKDAKIQNDTNLISTAYQQEQREFFNEVVLNSNPTISLLSSTNEPVKKSTSKSQETSAKKGMKGNTGGRCVPYPECKAPDF